VCKEVNCLFYVLEHRYYGSSQPFGDWSTGNLRYLNSSQALADLDYFIKGMNVAIRNKYGVGVHEWLTIGGSYPGALSAWFKSLYTSASAAWSSSGVIDAIRDYSQYDSNNYLAMQKSGGNCTEVVQAVVKYVDLALKGQLPQDQIDYVRQVFQIPEGMDGGDFMYFLADIFAGRVQRGARRNLCNILQSI
jgi:hypothetical protein